MIRRLVVGVLVVLGLTACQGKNPYVASALPESAIPMATERIDPSSYPAPPIDYGRYRYWAWTPEGVTVSSRTPQTMDVGRVRDAISGQLDQRGLRPAQAGNAPDLYVNATVREEQRVQYDTDYYSRGGYGSPYGYDRWGGHGVYGSTGYSHTQPRYYRVQVLKIDLIDAQQSKVIWSGSAEQTGGSDQSERARAIREAARRALEQYPPH
ncbi:uncharacterized protein DUF4136 [Pseudomonas duriflava]|uniref:Uncharacterized protein DUF4136 n=1 Tax=Pseudomonas duriflava TaxID=459528 RepID=A0A562QCB7_9PSED|nr:DUF4136 domain-containing protein [Pseudomonas duriflava]TWI54391.1 uncharacterized protein DUF4136 [Pseudomonas duriflava]